MIIFHYFLLIEKIITTFYDYFFIIDYYMICSINIEAKITTDKRLLLSLV